MSEIQLANYYLHVSHVETSTITLWHRSHGVIVNPVSKPSGRSAERDGREIYQSAQKQQTLRQTSRAGVY